jgi:hypothetical protein
MKNLLFIFLFLMSGLQLFAQIAQSDLFVNAIELNQSVNQANGYKVSSYIKGTPYLNENDMVGTFYLKNKNVIKTPTKLNVYYNSFEYKIDEKSYLVNPTSIDSVSMNNETYVYKNFYINGECSPKIVKIVDNKGVNKMYVYKSVNLKPEVKAAGYIDPKPAQFEWSDPVYVFEINSKMIVLRNFKNITELFPNEENNIKKYIKNDHIHINNQENLKKLLGYISQIKQ